MFRQAETKGHSRLKTGGRRRCHRGAYRQRQQYRGDHRGSLTRSTDRQTGSDVRPLRPDSGERLAGNGKGAEQQIRAWAGDRVASGHGNAWNDLRAQRRSARSGGRDQPAGHGDRARTRVRIIQVAVYGLKRTDGFIHFPSSDVSHERFRVYGFCQRASTTIKLL